MQKIKNQKSLQSSLRVERHQRNALSKRQVVVHAAGALVNRENAFYQNELRSRKRRRVDHAESEEEEDGGDETKVVCSDSQRLGILRDVFSVAVVGDEGAVAESANSSGDSLDDLLVVGAKKDVVRSGEEHGEDTARIKNELSRSNERS